MLWLPTLAAAAKVRTETPRPHHSHGPVSNLKLELNFSFAEGGKYRSLFVHIPKTAGSTIEDWGAKHGYSWGMNMNWPTFTTLAGAGARGLGRTPWHIPPKLLQVNTGINPYQGMTTFCVVRHPYMRAISEYLYSAFGGAEGCKANNDRASSTNDDGNRVNVKGEVLPGCDGVAAHRICTPDALNEWVAKVYQAMSNSTMKLHSPVDGKPTHAWKNMGRSFQATNMFNGARNFAPNTYSWHLAPQWTYAESCDHILRFKTLAADWKSIVGEGGLAPEAKTEPLPNDDDNDEACSLQVGSLSSKSRIMLAHMYRKDFERLNFITDVLDSPEKQLKRRSKHRWQASHREHDRKGKHGHDGPSTYASVLPQDLEIARLGEADVDDPNAVYEDDSVSVDSSGTERAQSHASGTERVERIGPASGTERVEKRRRGLRRRA